MSTNTIHLKKLAMSRRRRNFWLGLLFILPWLIGFLLFSLYPILASAYYSLTDYSFFKSPSFVGLKNYQELMGDDKFWKSLTNTLYFTAFVVPLQLFISLIIASLLNIKIKGQSIYRTLFYIPSIIPMVSTSLLWIWVLNGEYGVLNNVLGALSLPEPGWLTDPHYTKWSLIMMQVWASGGIMVIYLAALQDIPRSMYEAADLEGASVIQKFFKITIPYLSPVTLFQFIIAVVAGFQYFAQALVFSHGTGEATQTVGGPENSILFYSVYLYQNAFSFLRMGYSSAMAWMLFVIISVITYLTFKWSNKSTFYGGD